MGFGDGSRLKTLPDFVPAALQPTISKAAQRWNVSGALLAAQLYAESNFNPFAESGAGAQGIAQFMPGTAQAYGITDPFDPAQSIDAQAQLMRDLLRRFASVPLALAAYNAGPARVAACGCIPTIPETQAYVAKILGLLGGAGEGPAALEVRLLRPVDWAGPPVKGPVRCRGPDVSHRDAHRSTRGHCPRDRSRIRLVRSCTWR